MAVRFLKEDLEFDRLQCLVFSTNSLKLFFTSPSLTLETFSSFLLLFVIVYVLRPFLIAGKYVGNRPIKLRKSNWKERTDYEALGRHKVKERTMGVIFCTLISYVLSFDSDFDSTNLMAEPHTKEIKASKEKYLAQVKVIGILVSLFIVNQLINTICLTSVQLVSDEAFCSVLQLF